MLRLSGILLFEHAPTALLDVLVTRIRTIVKTAEDLVPGCLVGTVVTIEIAVMQLMHEITDLQTEKTSQSYAVITTM